MTNKATEAALSRMISLRFWIQAFLFCSTHAA